MSNNNMSIINNFLIQNIKLVQGLLWSSFTLIRGIFFRTLQSYLNHSRAFWHILAEIVELPSIPYHFFMLSFFDLFQDRDAIYREIDEPINVRKLFLGGLRSQSSERHLYEAFLPFGHIVDVLMVRGPNHKPKGFGFVTFSKAYMMEAVITAHPDMRVIVDGKSVEIKRISEGEVIIIEKELHTLDCFYNWLTDV